MNNETPQPIAPDITLTWLHDHEIAYFNIKTVARGPLATWFETIKGIMDRWPLDRPLLMIHDNDLRGVSFTPTRREYGLQLFAYRPELTMCIAIVLPRNFVNQIVRTFLTTMRGHNREVRVFSTTDEAVVWLRTQATRVANNSQAHS